MDYLEALQPQNQVKIRELLNKCQDPVWFSQNILGGSEPWGKQIEVMESVRDNKRTAVKSGNGVGKTWTAARTILWFLTAYRPSRVITTAPTWQQVEKLLWAEINTQFKSALIPLGGTMLNTQLKITDEHFAIGYSTDDSTKFQGHHSEHILVVFDEAMGVLPVIWEGAEGLLTNQHARFLVIGNPTIPAGNFYDCFKSPLWNKITISCYDCPNVVQDRIIYPRLVTKEWIEERKIEWGENSPLFKSKVLGEFPVEGEDTLIPISWVERSMNLQLAKENEKVLGIDVARYGDDRTAFIGLHGVVQILEHGYNGKDTTKTVGQAIRFIKDYGFTKVAIDDSGVGGGVVDQLQDQIKLVIEEMRAAGTLQAKETVEILPVNFGSKARDDTRFENLKAEIFWNLRLAFENQSLALTKSDTLLSELPSLMYEVTSRGRLKIVGKDEMKKMGLRSPDYADALVIAHYATYGSRSGILDFYRSETENNANPQQTITSQLNKGYSLETAFRNLIGGNPTNSGSGGQPGN